MSNEIQTDKTEPLHLFAEERTFVEGVCWFTAACKCGWQSNPKLTWFGMQDEIADHVLGVQAQQ